MSRIDGQRMALLERQTANLHQRVSELELQLAAPAAQPDADPVPAPAESAPPSPPAPAWPAPTTVPVSTAAPSSAGPTSPGPAPAATAAPAVSRRPSPDLEELLGGRVLAWIGGVAVVAGIAFLLAIAVSRGWIGPGARTALAGTFSLGLLGAGAWLYEHRRRTDAALATLSAGLAGLFMTVVVGGPVYAVLPAAVTLALAFATGALATCFAVRWQSRGIGALGIVGALLAPVLAGAPSNTTTLALLWLAAASGAAVLVWQRWNWLALAVFAIPPGQWVWWLGDRPPAASIIVVMCAFGALNVAAAVGFELRVPTTRLRVASALLLSANAMTLALVGWYGLDEVGATTAGRLWIGALAVVHLGVGFATRLSRVNRDVRMLALALGVVLADVTAGLLLEGPVLAVAFAATTAGFGLLSRRLFSTPPDGDEHAKRYETLAGLGLGGHLLLTTIQALTQAPPGALSSGDAFTLGGNLAIAATACAAFVAGRFVHEVRRPWRQALDVVALTGVAYLTAVALDGPMLAVAFAAEAVALAGIAARERDDVAACGGAAFLALALGHALLFEAQPNALVIGVDDLAGAAVALAAAAGAALFGLRLLGPLRAATSASTTAEDAQLAGLLARAQATLATTGALALLYLASVAVVTAFQPGAGVPETGLLELGVDQLGQLLLSGLWAIAGVAALVVGLRRDIRELRLGALALLLVTVGKVFLYDLSTLTSLYRVGSFVGLGLLLLMAAAIWARLRPPALPDLREVPPAVR